MPLFRFCFPAKEFKEWSSQIKKVTRLLGDARDLDVQIAFIEQYIKRLSSAVEKACVDILLKEHKDRRESIQPFVVNGLEKLQDSNILNDIRKFCEQTLTEQSNSIFELNQVLEKARWNISFRLDDFLSMEKYVYLENEKLKQHEMRICAKKLRYTMEAFAPGYENKLEKEIETIKAFQDVLGEMHDCDVWIEYIPKFIDETKAKNKTKKKNEMPKMEKALLNYLNYVNERRKEQYNQFVFLWNENKKSNFFNQLRKTISNYSTMTEEKTKQILANPEVKIAVLSDVHANLQALEIVIQDAEARGADIFLNAGDSIGFGPYPNEVVELLCEKNMLSVLGNYDLEVIEGKVKARRRKKSCFKLCEKRIGEIL